MNLRIMITMIALLGTSMIMTSCYYHDDTPTDSSGNASVKSVHFTIYQNDWQRDGSNLWYYELNENWIHWDIVDYGAVLVYMEAANLSDSWLMLPATMHYNDNGKQYVQEFMAWHSHKKIEVQYVDSHPLFPQLIDYNLKLKAIIIADYPWAQQKLEGVDINSYNAVSKALDIKEEIELEF
jgi:hypothetical protein